MKRPTSPLDIMVDRACGITDADYESDLPPVDPRPVNDPDRIAEWCQCCCSIPFAKAMDCARERGNKTRCACACHRPAVRAAKMRQWLREANAEIEAAFGGDA